MACFAYGQRVPVVDTNVRRVVARAVHGRADSPPSSRDLGLTPAHPGQALLESGQFLIGVATPVHGGVDVRVRAARERINSLLANGKQVRIIAVGRKSRDQLARLYGDKIVRTFELSEHKTVGLPAAQPNRAAFPAGNASAPPAERMPEPARHETLRRWRPDCPTTMERCRSLARCPTPARWRKRGSARAA